MLQFSLEGIDENRLMSVVIILDILIPHKQQQILIAPMQKKPKIIEDMIISKKIELSQPQKTMTGLNRELESELESNAGSEKSTQKQDDEIMESYHSQSDALNDLLSFINKEFE